MPPKYRLQMSEVMGSLSKKSPCNICCGKNKSMNIRHVHYSTNWYHKQMIRSGAMSPMCHFCDITHPVDHMTRQKIILSTSTLNGIQYMDGWSWDKPPTHCDMETIAGATIPTLRKAWERSYSSNPLPTDTILVAGLNDLKQLVTSPNGPDGNLQVLAESVSEDFMHRVRSLHRLVLEHSDKYMVDDTFAVATVIHVPAYYWHQDDGSYPSPNYINYKEVVDRINLKIQEFNILIGSAHAPKFHEVGERGQKKGQKRTYMWEAFREERKDDMMHLKDIHRAKMVKLIIRYFEKGTPKTYQHLD